MNEKSRQHYAPWERTEQADLQVQQALDQANEEQLAGFIDALLEQADKHGDAKDERGE